MNHSFHIQNRLLLFIIIGLLQVGFTQQENKKLADAVKANIERYYLDKVIVSADITGKVLLKGEVNSLYDRLEIFELASQVSGVKYIEDFILVNSPTIPDNMILANIKHALAYINTISEPDLIQITVKNGMVFLQGKVRFYRESIMVQTMVSWQQGVKGIANELQVEPILKAVSDESITGVIDDLMKDQFIPEKNILYTVKSGHVTLNGSTNSLWTKTNIESAIRKIVGVTRVENNLQVK